MVEIRKDSVSEKLEESVGRGCGWLIVPEVIGGWDAVVGKDGENVRGENHAVDGSD
jgi:hypothetical protein